MTARQVTASCPARPGAALAQARRARRGPLASRVGWAWGAGGGGRARRCPSATPRARRGLCLCALLRSAPPGRGRRARAMPRSVAGPGRKSWRKLRAAPLPRRPCPAGEGGGDQGRGGGDAGGGKGRLGRGEPGAPCGAAVPEPGPPLASARLSSSGAGFLAWRRDPPQRRQEQLRLSVNKLLCGGVSRASGRGVCAFVCVRSRS